MLLDRWLQQGRRVPGMPGTIFDPYDVSPPEWIESGPRILVFLVITEPTNKPFKVSPDNIILLGDDRRAQ